MKDIHLTDKGRQALGWSDPGSPCHEAFAQGMKIGDGHNREALAIVEKVAAWLDEYYGPVEHLDGGYRAMIQHEHGSKEYAARMDIAEAVRTLFP